MVRHDAVHHIGVFVVLPGKLGAQGYVRALALVVHCLADVMQQAGALRQSDVRTQLCGHQACEVAHFDGVLQHVLAIAGTEPQAAQQLDEFVVNPVLVGFEDRVLPGFADLVLHFLPGFFNHLFDPGGVNPSVHNQLFNRDPRDFPADRIERRHDHGFRRIVDNQVDACCGFQRPDVPAFTADDPALHVVIRQVDHADRALGHVVCRTLLDRQGDDVPGFLFPVFLRLGFNIPHHGGGVMISVPLDLFDHELLCFVPRQAGNPFQFAQLSVFQLGNFLFLLCEVCNLFIQVLLAGFQVIRFLLQCFLTLDQAAFILLDFVPPFADFTFVLSALPVVFSFGLQDFFLGFQHLFLLVIFRFPHRVIIQAAGIFLCPVNFLFRITLPVQITEYRTKDTCYNGNPDCENG